MNRKTTPTLSILSDAVEGYLYCMYNEVYIFYGNNVYKLGQTNDFDIRLKGYCTPYIKPCELMYLSEKIRNKVLAENILFEILAEYRITDSREFFKCDLNIIQNAIDRVVKLFDEHTDDELYKLYNNEIYNVNNIIKSANISDVEYDVIKSKPHITPNELNLANKYLMMKMFVVNLADLGEEFIVNNFNKMHVMRRYNLLFDNNIYHKYVADNDKINVIKNIIDTLGFSLNDMSIKLSKDDYYVNVKKLLSTDNNFYNEYDKIRKLFKKEKHIIKDNLSGSALAKLLNGFLENFGLCIKCHEKSVRSGKKISSAYSYQLHEKIK